MLPEILKDTIRTLDEQEFATAQHFGLGMHIRNYWGLWQQKELYFFFDSLGIPHPDEMSGIILTAYHRHLTGRDINLNELVNSTIQNRNEYLVKMEEYHIERQELWNTFVVGDTVEIDFLIYRTEKFPSIYSIDRNEDISQQLEEYELCTWECVVTNKSIEDIGAIFMDQFYIEIRILSMCGYDKVKIWHLWNRTKIGDIINYKINHKNIRKKSL
ncbi:MAG: DUF6794 domain-containing protein [Cyclobacteriaceae bacterium]